MTKVADSNDPRLPAARDCVLPYLVQRSALDRPQDVFSVFEDGEEWRWGDVHREVTCLADGLRRLGLKRDGKLLVWLPNGKPALRAMFAANYLGAVIVAINTAYRGGLLEHVLANSGAEIALVHPDLAPRLLELRGRGQVRYVLSSPDAVARHATAFMQAGLDLQPWSVLEGNFVPGLPVADIRPWTTQSIVYTSGTTGPSKGVLSSYVHLCTAGIECMPQLAASDRYMINLPLFHAGATLAISASVARGASIALIGEFRTDTFLETCKRLGCTATILLGVMASFLLRRPPSPADRDHSLRLAMLVPLSEDAAVLKARFGFNVVTVFNMSETSAPIRSGLNPTVRGSCGRPRPGIEARIVDENDCEVAAGQVGELLLRADAPWVMAHGYHEMPEATARAWRNGWFHTGDAFRKDENDEYFFVDRVKDAIRRRGENISSFEVECEAMAHEAVQEVAALGVPSEFGEEDVMVVVALRPGATLPPDELIAHLMPRMPAFMVPRYVRFVDALPKTPTAKVQKHVLRNDGLTSDTWDRERAGIQVKREKFSV
ncbi:ATP-dependent acyl-CoA ligase [Methylobacterium fujisawaense]|uniref:AMP-binding protein n=1 Tax=Methylobacterium fujisawaense TaxID=107400 RepID=UPI002F32CA60